MSDAAERFRRALDDLGIDPPVRRFEEPVPSAAAAAERLGCDRAAIANSLLFEAGDGVVLVLASGAHRVDLARVAAHLGVGRKKVRRADPELVLAVTGQRVGGVSPVGHPAALPTLVDHDLADHEVVWAAAGDAHTVFATTAAELVRITGGTLLRVAEG